MVVHNKPCERCCFFKAPHWCEFRGEHVEMSQKSMRAEYDCLYYTEDAHRFFSGDFVHSRSVSIIGDVVETFNPDEKGRDMLIKIWPRPMRLMDDDGIVKDMAYIKVRSKDFVMCK